MSNEKQFLSFVNENISFVPDYSLIKSEVNEERLINKTFQVKNVNTRKEIFLKSLKLVIYTICICLISVFLTILIQQQLNNDISVGDVSPNKLDEEYLEESFDTFVAFGGGSRNMFSIDLLINSNLIKQEDKKALSDYTASCSGANNRYYNIYLGVKNGKDIIELHHLSKPYKIFKFSSNLDYTFDTIIQEIEELSGEKLNKEFLLGSNNDPLIGEETLGIVADFKKNENGQYSVYFKSILNGKLYMIDK